MTDRFGDLSGEPCRFSCTLTSAVERQSVIIRELARLVKCRAGSVRTAKLMSFTDQSDHEVLAYTRRISMPVSVTRVMLRCALDGTSNF